MCEYLVDYLATETAAAAAAGTTFEVGWRLTSDGRRLGKKVAWAQSELGFGAAVEAACSAAPADTQPVNHTLPAMVQLELDSDRALRRPNEDDASARHDQLLGTPLLEQYAEACLQFVFEHEDALDPVRRAP
eukprot:SAG31_NODE_5278_length_2636_cov_2.017737_1_plen_132_part_00